MTIASGAVVVACMIAIVVAVRMMALAIDEIRDEGDE